MDYNYNTQREKLRVPEYGRNIQNMVNHVVSIENREERNKAAQTIISIMQNMIPQSKDFEEFKHKLWDHLALLSDFKIDVDAPYELPSREKLAEKPKPIPYNSNPIRFKHYGRNNELMAQEAAKMEEGEEKDRLIELIANHMKRSYLTWNRNQVTDEQILEDLQKLAGQKLEIKKDLILTETRNLLTRPKKKKTQIRKK